MRGTSLLTFLDPTTWPGWLVWFLAVYGLGLLAVAAWEYIGGIAGRRAAAVPLLSLVTVVRDRQDFVEGAIRSFFARYGRPDVGRSPYELVVVDDQSSDDTPRILRRLQRQYPGLLTVVSYEGGARSYARSPADAGTAAGRGEVTLLVDLEALAEPDGLAEATGILAGTGRSRSRRLTG